MSEIKPIRTCFANPNDSSQAYFIRNYQFVTVHWTPGRTADTIVHGPASLDYWPAIRDAGIPSINGVLFFSDNGHRAYIFSGGLYFNATFDSSGVLTVGLARSISSSWKTLAQAEFTTIDAVMPVPGHKNEAYFFSGTKYVRIHYVPGSSEERIVFGPTEIHNEWLALKQANFSTIDCILPHPTQHDRAYFFSGNKYCQIKMKPGSRDNSIVSGPSEIGTHYWPSLYQAKFYD